MELVPVNVGRQVGSSSHGVAVGCCSLQANYVFCLFAAEEFLSHCLSCSLKVNFTSTPFATVVSCHFFLLDLL